MSRGRADVLSGVRGVLFDLDGTLHDRRETVRRYLAGHAQRFPLPEGYTARWTELDDLGYRPKREVFPALAAEFGLPHPPEALLADWDAHGWADVALMDGAAGLLADLRARGLRLGLVTNGRSDGQRRTLGGLGLSDAFDAVIVSEELGLGKPDPRIYALALERLGLSAPEVLFVGDSPRNDVQGPQRAGMRAAWLPTSHPLPEGVTPDLVLDSLADLRALLVPKPVR